MEKNSQGVKAKARRHCQKLLNLVPTEVFQQGDGARFHKGTANPDGFRAALAAPNGAAQV